MGGFILDHCTEYPRHRKSYSPDSTANHKTDSSRAHHSSLPATHAPHSVGMARRPCGPSQLVYGYFFPPPDGAFPRPPPDGFPVVLGQLPPPPLPPPPLGIFHPSCRLTSAHEVRDTVGLDYRKPQTASSSPMPCARRTLAGAPSLIASPNERHASPQELTCSLRRVHHHGCPGHSLYRHWRSVWRA